MEFPILYQRSHIGTVRLRRQGLYMQIEAQCEQQGNTPLRLWLVGSRNVNLGIPLPEDGRLRLSRRISSAQLKGEWQSAILGDPSGQWLPFSGELLGCRIENGLQRSVAQKTEFAVTFSEEASAGWLPLLPKLRLLKMDETPWLVLRDT